MGLSDPIRAWRALQDAGIEAWLLHSAGAHPEAQRSILVCDAAAHLKLQHGKGWQAGKPCGDARDAMRQFARNHCKPDRAGPAIVGWLGFEAATIFEPSLPDTGAVQGEWWAVETAIIFEANGTTFHGDPQRISNLRAILDAAPCFSTSRSEPQSSTTPPATSMDAPTFCSAVERIRDLVFDGDLFQANIATRFSMPYSGTPDALLATLEAHNPSPFMAIMPTCEGTIVSGSPELLFATRGDAVRTRPIAGTRRRGETPDDDHANEQELLADPKERAEHMMLVDLLRNDVARVSQPGTTRVAEAMSVERYSHVMHMVSRVEGTLQPGRDVVDCLEAIFPGGTVTGAPKPRATARILEAEPVPRGPYTGSVGWIGHDGNSAWNILIRTILLADGEATIHAGAGIVADSVAEREWKESNSKASAFLGALAGGGKGATTRLGEVQPHGSWEPPTAQSQHPEARVLLIDNEDSFVYNLADYCAALGATARVVRNDCDAEAERDAFGPTHVILSPGPGWPAEAGATLDACRWQDIPILGVCLGHQALAEVHGGTLSNNPPRHGMTDAIASAGEGLFAHLPDTLTVARYHSIHVATAPPGWHVDAMLGDMIMALRDPQNLRYGVQFHPESMGTPHGMALLERFLQVRP